MVYLGKLAVILIGSGSLKSCCNKPRSPPCWVITSAFYNVFLICTAWLRHSKMRSCPTGQGWVITLGHAIYTVAPKLLFLTMRVRFRAFKHNYRPCQALVPQQRQPLLPLHLESEYPYWMVMSKECWLVLLGYLHRPNVMPPRKCSGLLPQHWVMPHLIH